MSSQQDQATPRIGKLSSHLGALPKGPTLAVLLSAGLAAWMSLGPAPVAEEVKENSTPTASYQSVRTILSSAQETTRIITAEGDTSAARRGIVSPRISGILSEILVSKGQAISTGQPIARLEIPGFAAKEDEARVRRDEAQRAYDNAQALARRELASQDRLVSARTDLASAESQWASVQEQRQDMTLAAPFSGVLDTLDIEIGDNLSPGDTVAEILDLSRLTIKATIPQAQISSLQLGQAASVSLVTGEKVVGLITYISSQADRQTRSFPVEVEIDNEGGALKAGVSASIEMKGETSRTHAVPSAYLSLGSDGDLIVKSVDDGIVVSHTVEVVSSGLEEVLVSGLPDEIEIITVGQGFVQSGDAVRSERLK